MVQLGGLEPPTSGSTDRRSNQLSYSCTGSRASGRKLEHEPEKWKPCRSRKSPGEPARADATLLTKRSGDLLHRFADAALDRLGGLRRDLLREAGELLALAGERLEVLTRMLGRELDEFRRRLHAEQRLDVVEHCFGVGAGDLEHLQAVLGRALGGGRVDGL